MSTKEELIRELRLHLQRLRKPWATYESKAEFNYVYLAASFINDKEAQLLFWIQVSDGVLYIGACPVYCKHDYTCYSFSRCCLHEAGRVQVLVLV